MAFNIKMTIPPKCTKTICFLLQFWTVQQVCNITMTVNKCNQGQAHLTFLCLHFPCRLISHIMTLCLDLGMNLLDVERVIVLE